MIRNARQAAVARRTREGLLRSAAQAPAGHETSYLELAGEVGRELEEYESIRDGRTTIFDVADIDALGACLVKARLARGWTIRHLAASLGVTEQAVQRDERQFYERAGLARLAEIADVLGYRLVGSFSPQQAARAETTP